MAIYSNPNITTQGENHMQHKVATVVFLQNEKGEIFMGRKTQKIGIGMYTGPGGKVEPGEAIETCARRETFEEIQVKLKEASLRKIAIIQFYNHHQDPTKSFLMEVHFFLANNWEGTPRDTEELKDGRWFPLWRLRWFPWSVKMMAADKIFLPYIAAGQKIKAKFHYDGTDQKKLTKYVINQVERFL
ncbi:MAG: NUDIX domain-containing protein [Candidatus Vogelbacteria bacterium]|nr:NUDIX domain-containing protein [Candidatus Vogelbacteria bacterium]